MRAFVATLTFRIASRVPLRLHAFARAEESSRVDLVLAARACPSAERAALYLRHASDEARHARAFARRADELRQARGECHLGAPDADVEALYDRLGEVGFLAFVHRGEARGLADFEAYSRFFRARGEERTANVIDALVPDERRHAAYTRALLVEIAGGEQAARRALRRAAVWEGWRTFRRAGRALTHPLYTATAMLLYVLCAPLALLVRVIRPARAGLHEEPESRTGIK